MDKETQGQIVFGICVALGPVAMGMRKRHRLSTEGRAGSKGGAGGAPARGITCSPLLPCGKQHKPPLCPHPVKN